MKKIFTLTCLLFISLESPANISDSGDIARLQYGWYPGISAEVKYKHSEATYILGENSKSFNFNGNFLLRTIEHSKGMQIDFNEIYFHFDESNDTETNNKLQQFIQELIGISPSYVIDPQGTLVEVTKFERFRNTIKDEMLKFFDDSSEQELTQVRQFIEAMFSKEQVMLQLHDDWNRDVGQWVGGELEHGYAYDVEFNRAIPMLGNIEVPNKGRYEFLGRTACNRLDKNNSCVRLKYQSYVDEEATKPIITALFESLGVSNTEDFKLKIDYSVEIITEENNLLPHYVKEKTTTIVPNPQQGGYIEKEEIDEYVYTYIKR